MRLDQYLLEKNLVKTRSQATDYIKRGLVLNHDDLILKPGYQVKDDDLIKLVAKKHFVSRAGEKLFHAIVEFDIVLHDKVVIDVGSSTGGFTDCALDQGAKEVYAYDVGSEQMDLELRKDSRIHLFEQTNFLDVDVPKADMCLVDVSFTSVMPIIKHLKGFNKEMLILIKPQFEAGHNKFKGVLKDKKMHEHILKNILGEVISLGFHVVGIKKSFIKGKKGNQEYVLYINHNHQSHIDLRKAIGDVLC